MYWFFISLLILVIGSLLLIVILSCFTDEFEKFLNFIIDVNIAKNYFYVILLILFPVVFGFLALEIASRHKYEFDKNLKQLLFLLIMMELNLAWQIYYNVIYDKKDDNKDTFQQFY